jgi:hypothetical protein
LVDVAHKFRDCLQKDKSKCHAKNKARFHYADIRVITPLIENFLLILSDLSTERVEQINYANMMTSFNKIRDLSFDELLNETKISKQFDDIPNVPLRNFLYKKADFYLNKFYPDAELYDDFLSNPTNILRDELYIQLLDFLTYIVDFYILGRMFRSFVSNTNNNIIIYVGDDHADNIRTTLNELGFTIIKHVSSDIEGSNFQCLDLSKKK